MAAYVFGDLAGATVTSGGTTAPASGTTETWTVSGASAVPSLAAGQRMAVADPSAKGEVIDVTAISGTTWTVTRGADSTTPLAHSPNFTVVNVISAGFLGAAQQRSPNAVVLTIDGTQTPGSGGTGVKGNFQPWVELAPGSTATVTWVMPDGSVITGLKPTINYSTTSTYTVTMVVTDALGNDASWQVTGFNAGYDDGIDYSTDGLGTAKNWTDYQLTLTGAANVKCLTGLTYFAAEHAGLTGTLDLTGLAQLTNIEVYGCNLNYVLDAGCASLRRRNVESCNLTEQNLNFCAPTVKDVRAAIQNSSHGATGGTLTQIRQVVPFARLWHYCLRDQTVTELADISTMLPVVQQLWIWNTGSTGTCAPASSALTSLQAYGNSYTALDMTNAPMTTANAAMDMHSCQIATVTGLAGCTGLLTIDLSSNLLPQAQVDSVLSAVNGWGTSNGTLNLGGTGNAAPSSTGLSTVTTLQGRGWTVTHN